MSRPVFKLGGGVLATMAAGALLFAPGTAPAGVMPVEPSQFVSPFDTALAPEPSTVGWMEGTAQFAPRLSSDQRYDLRLPPSFGQSEPLAAGEDTPIAVSLPDQFVSAHSAKVVGEHVNSIPALPALWSGLSGFAGVFTLASLKRLRRSLR